MTRAEYKTLAIGTVVALVALLGFLYAHKINLVTADLGRHLKNGELFLQTWQPIKTNFYSYTEPNFPVINHHWASGALFFLIWKITGFSGLQLFFIALNLSAFLICFNIARKHIGVGLATLLALPIIPLLAERTEIRPEALSYLFAALFFWIVFSVRNGARSARFLWILPLIQIFWVNSHIFFFLGPAIIGAFLLESIIAQSRRHNALTFLTALAGTAIAACINPFGIRGIVAPFTILKNYGYLIVENQSVWFIQKLFAKPSTYIFEFVFLLLALSVIIFFVKKRARVLSHLAFVFLAAGFSFLAWFQIRNFALFGLIALPLTAFFLKEAFGGKISAINNQREKIALWFAGATVCVAGLLLVSTNLPQYIPYWRQFGFGLEEGNNAAADFMQKNGITGPLFNNYDIGGYLIWHLFPKERVFVDNRPEAYRVDFFKKTYVAAQENESVWRDVENMHRFNAIVFSYHDMTPWGQKFLISRINDPEWAPVFADQYVIIFLKRNEKNLPLIRAHEIPKNAFRVS